MFPYFNTGLPGSIIQKYKEKINPNEREKWEKAFDIHTRGRKYNENLKLWMGGGEKKELCTPKEYVRVNGDPFYKRYRIPIEEKKTYKSEEDIAECNNPKSSIHALIIFKECGDSILMQYERIIVNNKLYSERYMDKKIVETLCDDEPVESDETEPLNLSDNNLEMFNRSDSRKSSDSTNSSGYDFATEDQEEGNPSGGRKKTRRKKHKKTKRKNKTKRDKTHKKNKKRTRRMKR
jgi:hypothetical protein